MDSPMEFWGVEVKVGQSVKVDPMEELNGYIHISQVALGEAKKDNKASEPVVVYLKLDDQKFVLGTLNRSDIPQLSMDLVLEKEAELSHNSKNASVYFCGYKVITEDADDFSGSEDELALNDQDNGKPEIKAEDAKVIKSGKPLAKTGALAKQVKIVDPKNEEDESDDDSADEDEFGSSDEMDADSGSDEESESDEDEEETPAKKVDQGKKRPNESASKTPIPKKAKNAPPEKTDGKKGGHTATPHPMKKGGKTPISAAKDKTPNSGGLSCQSCSKNFTSESGLQQHKKAKHGGQ